MYSELVLHLYILKNDQIRTCSWSTSFFSLGEEKKASSDVLRPHLFFIKVLVTITFSDPHTKLRESMAWTNKQKQIFTSYVSLREMFPKKRENTNQKKLCIHTFHRNKQVF